MIKPEELRIGNCLRFYASNDIYRVNAILLDKITCTHNERVQESAPHMYDAIKLTSNILRSCGFTSYYRSTYVYQTEKRDVFAKQVSNENCFEIFLSQTLNNESFVRTVFELHILQNLIFLLTKVELEVNMHELIE